MDLLKRARQLYNLEKEVSVTDAESGPSDGTASRIEMGFFLGLLVGLSLLFLFVVSGFFQPIFWAVLIGVLFQTMQRWFEKRQACLLYTSPSPRD